VLVAEILSERLALETPSTATMPSNGSAPITSTPGTLKRCSVCLELKALGEFDKGRTQCQPCRRERARETFGAARNVRRRQATRERRTAEREAAGQTDGEGPRPADLAPEDEADAEAPPATATPFARARCSTGSMRSVARRSRARRPGSSNATAAPLSCAR
jgi:hypothetical protein